MEAPRESLSEFRARLSELLSGTPGDTSVINPLPPGALVPMSEAEMFVPAQIGDYTDFYASIYHATNVGKIFRPDNPLFPNYKHVPIAYHGRASSIVISGTDVTIEWRSLVGIRNYEAEVGFFVGRGTKLGETISIEDAEQHLFGICLVNDWSARDIQSWEYQPLGPFLSKNFATTVSPWVVTWEALEPYRAPAFFRPPSDPQPLPHLSSDKNRNEGGLDLNIEVYIRSMLMREGRLRPFRLSAASLADMYWTPAQMLTHHASNGCNLLPGDLFASGTVSGPESGSQGCLLELTRRGANPIVLPTGEERKFLHDGDEIIMRAYLEKGPRDGSNTQSMIETGFYLLTGVDLTPAQQAAVYHALARVPGLTVVPKMTDILGRTGVGIRSRPGRGMSWTAIFDRTTFKLLGADIEPTGPGYDRTAMAVQPTVVNKVGQRPTR